MKKAYVKPALFAETFQLAVNIAGACPGITPGGSTQTTRTTCAYHMGGTPAGQAVFNAGVLGCDLPIDAQEYGEDCYNGPFLELPSEPFGSF